VGNIYHPRRPKDPLIGTVLQRRYRVEERIGEGGMGVVYRAVQVPFERDAAIKVLAAAHSDNESLVRRFAAEALIISRLRHPNTLKPYDFGKTPDGRLYIVTEYLDGDTLGDLLEPGALDPVRTLRYLGQVCDSLVEAHGRGIVHRDLKPGNIFVERVGHQEVVKVLDFGVAKVVEGVTETAAGAVCGTPVYMSPEQADGRDIDARSDLYAIGVIAYECLTGRPPFSGPTPVSVLLKHVNEQPTPLRDALPGQRVRPDLEGLVLSLLEKDRRLRPANAAEVRQRIDAVLQGPAREDPDDGPGTSPSVPSAKRRLTEPPCDPFGATVYASQDDAALVTRVGVLSRLRRWLRGSRATRWLLLLAAAELVVALALAGWAAHLASGGGAPRAAAGPADAGAADVQAAEPPAKAKKRAKKKRKKRRKKKQKKRPEPAHAPDVAR